eukprot:gb/GEZN01002180.1/.p1 GENE.gb/GEZN01002180.1/~~gb/GEZN01002180.1/.p1  ORF type:complete len:825 (+),score=123.18 gb/GEZN01002180.1/:53-2527(+)
MADAKGLAPDSEATTNIKTENEFTQAANAKHRHYVAVKMPAEILAAPFEGIRFGDIAAVPMHSEDFSIFDVKKQVEKVLGVKISAQQYVAQMGFYEDEVEVSSIYTRQAQESLIVCRDVKHMLILRVVDMDTRDIAIYLSHTGQECVIKNCSPKLTVLQFKQRLVNFHEWMIEADMVNILHEGKLARDDSTLEEYSMFQGYSADVSFKGKAPTQDSANVGEAKVAMTVLKVKVEQKDYLVNSTPSMIVTELLTALREKVVTLPPQVTVLFGEEVAMPYHQLNSYRDEQLQLIRVEPFVDALPLAGEVLNKLDGFIETWKQQRLRYDTTAYQAIKLNSFEIDTQNPLGHGSNGQVFRAKLKGTPHVFALKKIWDVGVDRKSLGDVEWDIPMSFPHEHIGRVIHTFQDATIAASSSEAAVGLGRTRYLLMDLYPLTLEKLVVSSSRLDQRQILLLLLQLLQALSHLYKHGISHRDIKPSDICLSQDGELFLLDFGCATRTFVTPLVAGNRINVPPEGLSPSDDGINTKLFDVWAVGCLVYQILGEPHPFAREGPRQDQMPKTLPSKNPPLPVGYERLEELITQLLARDPDQRCRPEHAVRFIQHCLWPLAADHKQHLLVLAQGFLHEFMPRNSPKELAAMSEEEQLEYAIAQSNHRRWGEFKDTEQRLFVQFLRAEIAGLSRVHWSVRMRGRQSFAELTKALGRMGYEEPVVKECCRLLFENGQAETTINEMLDRVNAIDEKARHQIISRAEDMIKFEAAQQETASLRTKAQEQHELKLCVLCEEQYKNICFVPCGHICACASCAAGLQRCPMCQHTILQSVKVFL